MMPIDFSRATFAEISASLGTLRMDVWRGLMRHGPCTTAHLADALGISVLTVRPRVTELLQVGLARLADGERRGHEGVYEALTAAQAAQAQTAALASDRERQLSLRIDA